jgi:hypothetical protein
MPNDVPIMDAMDATCAVLRANAHERMGNMPAAVEALRRSMSAESPSGRNAMTKFRELFAILRLCEQSFAAATVQHTAVASRQAATRASGGIHFVFIPLGLLMLLAAFACVVVLILSVVDVIDSGFGTAAGIALVTLAPLGIIFTAIGFVFARAAKRAAYLRAHGISGTGRVVGLSPTGTEINGVPQMQIRLMVELPGHAPYETTTKMLGVAVPPGAVVNVRADPRNPREVIIETR